MCWLDFCQNLQLSFIGKQFMIKSSHYQAHEKFDFFLLTKFYASKKVDQGQNCKIWHSRNLKFFQVVNICTRKIK